ncbi:MAG: aminoacyl-tRNA hydrolase [Betaproteobacteria bacterium]|nr:aminoacyl-tRNA hydrolase [Betaproteobacteria bacterium]NBT09813.1 aminoacyl-tRNA hydrolase [Betaproteobacteria bacterium]NBU48729.1 aminoacyl-tRNA hydrolase [Betaproteobacteria bacterium]NBX95666.1 aminoacyl-tRNA hydrolase [Betaproteobacteria bacterium]
MIRLIVGLGNPGPEYADTRHNAGFWWVDDAARRLKALLSTDKAYFGEVARVNAPLSGLAGPVWLLKPQTFMNLSGKSVGALARFFKLDPAEILVVHDELDLLPGQVKLKQGGGSAGHNGLKDISAQLGSPHYWRLRLGIGHPGDRTEVAAYVLRKPPAAERALVEQALSKSLDALEPLLRGEMDKASRLVHAQPPRPQTPKVTTPPASPASPASSSTPSDPSSGG